MATSRLNKYTLSLLTILIIALLPGCFTAYKCPDLAVGQFHINKWQGPSPNTVDIIRYKLGSGFKIQTETYSKKNIFVSRNSNYPDTISIMIGNGPVDKNGWPNIISQPMSSDYKLILDNKVEYRITDIESTNRGGLGCPLKSFKVNNHFYPNGGIDFEQNVGEPVTP